MIGIKTDCFAYRDDPCPRCKALKDLYCEREECGFYKQKKSRSGVNTNVRYKPH